MNRKRIFQGKQNDFNSTLWRWKFSVKSYDYIKERNSTLKRREGTQSKQRLTQANDGKKVYKVKWLYKLAAGKLNPLWYTRKRTANSVYLFFQSVKTSLFDCNESTLYWYKHREKESLLNFFLIKGENFELCFSFGKARTCCPRKAVLLPSCVWETNSKQK